MTHTSTEQERAEFEAVASDNGKWPKAIERDAKGNYLLLTTANGWMWWQAARRAPVGAVPQAADAAYKSAWAEHIGAMDKKHDTSNNNNFFVAGYRAALASAPQPPEAAPHALQTERGLIGENPASKPVAQGSVSNATLAAPVELPEPEWWINYCAFTSKETASRIQESELASAPLYTEQQVRQLLAAHGIGKDKQG